MSLPAAWLFCSLALGAEPTVAQLKDHKVSGVVVVAAAVEQVRAVLSDPRNIARIDNNGTSVELLDDSGRCQTVRTTVQNPIASIVYDAEVCPIDSGWRTRLLRSDDLEAFESTWRVQARSDGQTRVQYEVRTIPDLPIPQLIVDRATRSSVHSMLVKLRDHMEGQAEAGRPTSVPR